MNYKPILGFVLLTAVSLKLHSQKIILGAGKSPQVKVEASDQHDPPFWNKTADAQSVFDGSGLVYDLYDASRFLYQSSLGASMDEIKRVASIGKNAWIDEQMSLPYGSMSRQLDDVIEEVIDWFYLNGGDSTEEPEYFYSVHFNYAWWQMNLTNRDKLRQRVALALSEIFVISANSDLGGYPRGMSDYYDLLIKHAFGNYRNLLFDITMHPMMGVYLSHLNNPKTNIEENIRPDENYAREIMQLFSVGLYELNPDGTRKKDSLGKDIPTYTQRDIQELAKVFTGLSFSEIMQNQWIDTPQFGVTLYLGIPTKPMRMFDNYHEQGQKTIIGGHVIPDGQTGMKDIQDALDILFNHPNVGPFLSKLLIQRLVKSNPSNAYVARVSAVFNKDEKGVRGNLGAVIKAILMDEEARTCEWLEDADNGQLREPLLRFIHGIQAIGVEQYYGRLWNSSYELLEGGGQIAMHAPSVFNFFLPNYQPKGSITDKGLVAPEFQLHNSKTGIGFINVINNWIYNYVMYSWEQGDVATIFTMEHLKELARDPETLLNRLDVLLTHGRLSDRTREIIKSEIYKLKAGDFRDDRSKLALYLMMFSPDYAIFK